jgi:hypothetical protein
MISLVFLPLAVVGASSLAAVRKAAVSPHGAFREDCGLCHGAQGWKPAKIGPRFDHARYGFPLTGAHAAAGCLGCHTSLEFKRADAVCASCHEDPHRGEMGLDCARCHGARSFLDRSRMVRAHQQTRFPLTGNHAGLECETCHVPAAQGQMQFVNTRADCKSCHMADYQSASQPAHAAGGFSLECASCHTPLGWNAARFDHNGTAFPLTGAHLATPCASCHGDGVYNGKSTACVSCHQADYDGTQDPAHGPAGFGTDCATCHGTRGWDGASFDHDGLFFPIHSGAHQGRWSACSDCHTNASNYSVFTCLTCHPHDDRQRTDADHQGESGYQYESNACYSCHPRGRS